VVTRGPQPGALVLAVHPARRDSQGNWLTVVAVKQFGDGRTMTFTGDTTWQWSLQLRAMRRESPFVQFWGQAIRWLASKELKERATKPGVEAYTDKTYYPPGEKVVFGAHVRAEEGRATNLAEARALIHLPNAETSGCAAPGARRPPRASSPSAANANSASLGCLPPSCSSSPANGSSASGTNSVERGTSNVQHPTSNIQRPTLNGAALASMVERSGLSGCPWRFRGL
jgi:hypothetical protein